MLESRFQSDTIKRLYEMFPGADISKLDSAAVPGHQDILILWEDRWATLEFKKSKDAPTQPNQEYYVERHNRMSFSAFVYPENVEEVLRELEQAFKTPRRTRVSKS